MIVASNVPAPSLRGVIPKWSDFKGTPVEHLGHFHHWLLLAVCVFVGLMIVATIRVVFLERVRAGHETSTAGLSYVTGPMGAGKSLFGVRRLVAALVDGRYAITNQELLPGWAEKVCKAAFPREAKKPEALAARVAWLEGFYIYEPSLAQAMRYRVPCSYCGGDPLVGEFTGPNPTDDPLTCSHSGPKNEGRAVFVWDETHNDLNNRDFDGGYEADRESRAREKLRRRMIVRWATQSRKLGYSVYLLSQHHMNTDAQLRRVANNIIRLQNQRNAEGVWLAKILPRSMTLFLVYWYAANTLDQSGTDLTFAGIEPSRRERYWLRSAWQRQIYDSWATYHGIDDFGGDDSPIYLPAGGRRGAGPRPGGEAPGAPDPSPPVPELVA